MLARSCDRDFLLIWWFPWIIISNLISGLSGLAIILRCTERWWFITIREVTYNQVNSKPVWTMKLPDYWRCSLGPPIRSIKASISLNKFLTPGSFTSRLELLYTMLLVSRIVYRLSSLTFLLLSNCFRILSLRFWIYSILIKFLRWFIGFLLTTLPERRVISKIIISSIL